jgi:nitroreductase
VAGVDVEKAIRTRRTHKAYGPEPVDPGLLRELLELARWAPNHHVTNPWRFRVLGPRTREALMELADSQEPGSAVKLRRAPTLVAVTAFAGGEDDAQDREDLLATAVAAYIVLLAAHARGLAAYWRTVPLLDDPRARALLRIPPEETPVGLLYLGEAVQEQRVPERAPLEDYVIELE